MQTTLPQHDVVLLGIGHTNAHVLRMWRMQPIADARLTCISNFPIATYSGMLPGVLAGQYAVEEMQIDLVRLCAANGARLIVGNVIGLDQDRQELLFEDRSPVHFDVLSVGIGSVPNRAGVEADAELLLPIKPMQTFLARLESRLLALAAGQRQTSQASATPLRLAVVGGGAGGVEITFCLESRVRKLLGHVPLEITLIDSNSQIGSGASEGMARRVHRELQARGVQVVLGRRVEQVSPDMLRLDNGDTIAADLVLWATSATPPPLLQKLGLPTDGRGFLLTRRTLQTTADLPIFAVGDSGTIQGEDLPKAGVYAVREGPILWENIQHSIAGRPLVDYKPQRGFLKLLNTGDGRAIGEYSGFTFSGRWAWWLKDRIDRKFMAMYQDYSMADMPPSPLPSSQPKRQMRCAGCGGKLGASILSRALSRLEVPKHDSVLLGLDEPDDVAVLQPTTGASLAITTDFFAAPLDDPYLVGRISALHAASDVLAKGAKPVAALAIATIPPGPARQQERLLYDLLAGGLHELKAMGATLAGGHTIEGPELTIGYTIVAEQPTDSVRTKGGMRLDDVLVLTKPLGTGVLLAAHMQARLKGEWHPTLMDALLRSNQSAARILQEYEVTGATDITGFGLAGHLLEMLRPGDLGARIDLHHIPLLPGAAELLQSGLESTLAPENRAAEQEIDVSENLRKSDAYRVLFDPQTCGGLLFGVPERQLSGVLAELIADGDTQSAVIGRVTSGDAGKARIVIRGEA